MVLIEAQCAGLPCVASTEVPRIVKITHDVKFIKLSNSRDNWVSILNGNLNSKLNRNNKTKDIKNSGYDIKTEVDKLEKLYLDLLNGECYEKN